MQPHEEPLEPAVDFIVSRVGATLTFRRCIACVCRIYDVIKKGMIASSSSMTLTPATDRDAISRRVAVPKLIPHYTISTIRNAFPCHSHT